MALTQSHYRFGVVEGTESTHGWFADEDKPTNRVGGAGGQFLCRVCVQETAGVAESNLALQWQYKHSRNGNLLADWTNITTTSSVVRTGANAVFANAANCTKRLSGTGTFEASGAGCTHTGASGGAANDIVAGGNSETLIGLQILAADVNVGDKIELRVVRVGGALLTAYAVIPTLTVAFEVFPIANRAVGVTDNQANPISVPAGASGKTYFVHVTGLSQADLADATMAFGLFMYIRNPDLTWPDDPNASQTVQGPMTARLPGQMIPAVGWNQNGSDVAGKDVYFKFNNTGRAFNGGLAAAQV